MKKSIIITSLAALAAIIFSCSPKQVSETSVVWIQDNAEAKLNPVALFQGASQALVDSLGIQDGIPASMSVVYMECDGHKVLFDAGLGTPQSCLMAGLDSLGVEAADIEYVFLTHMHFDHIGGLMKDGAPAFPNAALYVSQAEYDAEMAKPEEASGAQRAVLGMYAEKLVVFGPEDSLPLGIQAVDVHGHTPGHCAYLKDSILIAGDIMHGTALQLADPTVNARFDADPAAAVEARLTLLEKAAAEHLTVYGMHFPAPGYIQF